MSGRTGFVLDFPTAELRGAEYNPRVIEPDTLEVLGRSIETVGFAKPIIVTQDGLIIAGHQRTKAARALGILSVPAYLLASINKYDEVMFNQLHNGTDLDQIDKPVFVPECYDRLGFEDVLPDDISGDMRSHGARIRSDIAGLLLRHGNWGCAVATQKGEVINSPQYLLACKFLKIPARIYRIPDANKEAASGFFQRVYGKFSYDHLERTTWIQSFAQPFRLRNGKVDLSKESNGASVLYRVALPEIRKPGVRIFDFGCGQGDLVKALQREGYDISGVEFFRRAGNLLDTGAVHRMCDGLARKLKTHGLFDIVICDSVINSVDTLQAENDVMVCLNALCKPGGLIYFSGRRTENIDQQFRSTKASRTHLHTLDFLDKDGFRGYFREGTWFYQKFHTEAQAIALGHKYLGVGKYIDHGNSWQYATVKTVELPAEEVDGAIMREFNLPWPGGKTVGKGDVVLAAYHEAKAMNQVAERRDSAPIVQRQQVSDADLAAEDTEVEIAVRGEELASKKRVKKKR